ncbi:MAG: pyridoxal-phosphate dependent enzyme [Rhodospirillaceae bacterium]|nr:pyridoxal-phosphate dependent enzyme [Rhodospirillaceae bacterium]
MTTPAAPARSILAMIGNTPMIEVTRLDTGSCRLFLKLENQNPAGSIKDRIALSMIEAAERDGRLKPGGTIVEATAGNTGLGLALVAGQKGYRLVLVIPDKMSHEKVQHVRALGAEVRMTRSDVGKGHPDYYQDVAARLAKEIPGAWFADQFSNPANPLAHETTTGPEIFAQMDGKVDAVVAGVGSGGTITGLARYFARVSPETRIVLADPQGSILVDYVKTGTVKREVGSWAVEGIGEDFIPPVADLSRVSEAYAIPDAEAFATARDVLRREGVLVGSSSGTLIAAALRYCRSRPAAERVVTLVCDSGNKYLSKMYNDFWMADQGYIERPKTGDLSDLIARRYADRAVVTVGPDEPLASALARMKMYDVSQLPVMENEQVVGIIDESDLLLAVTRGHHHFADPVRASMNARIETLTPAAPLEALFPIFARDHVAIVMDGAKFLGLITRIDLLNHLRRQMR